MVLDECIVFYLTIYVSLGIRNELNELRNQAIFLYNVLIILAPKFRDTIFGIILMSSFTQPCNSDVLLYTVLLSIYSSRETVNLQVCRRLTVCNLLFGLIGQFGLLKKDVSISFFLSFSSDGSMSMCLECSVTVSIETIYDEAPS